MFYGLTIRAPETSSPTGIKFRWEGVEGRDVRTRSTLNIGELLRNQKSTDLTITILLLGFS